MNSQLSSGVTRRLVNALPKPGVVCRSQPEVFHHNPYVSPANADRAAACAPRAEGDVAADEPITTAPVPDGKPSSIPLGDRRLLKRSQLPMYGITRTLSYELEERDPDFPAGFKLSPSSRAQTYWWRDELEAWLRRKQLEHRQRPQPAELRSRPARSSRKVYGAPVARPSATGRGIV